MTKSEETENEEKKSSFFMDAGIILAFLTASSYLIAFSYEKGYKSYYGLNEMFLSNVGITDILIAFTSISSIFLALYNLRNLYSRIIDRNSKNPIKVAINYMIAPITSFLIILIFVVQKDINLQIGIGIVFLFIILWILVIGPYLVVNNEKGYINRMEKYVQNVDKTPLIEIVKSLYKNNKITFSIALILLVFGISALTNLFGIDQARLEENYMVVNQNHKTYVVIGNQNGNFILAPLYKKSGVIKSEYIIINSQSDFSKPIIFQKKYFKNGLKVE
jgi:hypothetical protein